MGTNELRQTILEQARSLKPFPIEISDGTNLLSVDVKGIDTKEKRVFTGVEHMGDKESFIRQTLTVTGLSVTCLREQDDTPAPPPGWLDMRKLTADDPDEYFPVKFRN